MHGKGLYKDRQWRWAQIPPLVASAELTPWSALAPGMASSGNTRNNTAKASIMGIGLTVGALKLRPSGNRSPQRIFREHGPITPIAKEGDPQDCPPHIINKSRCTQMRCPFWVTVRRDWHATVKYAQWGAMAREPNHESSAAQHHRQEQ
jgi:hypothetical protein